MPDCSARIRSLLEKLPSRLRQIWNSATFLCHVGKEILESDGCRQQIDVGGHQPAVEVKVARGWLPIVLGQQVVDHVSRECFQCVCILASEAVISPITVPTLMTRPDAGVCWNSIHPPKVRLGSRCLNS